MIITIGCIIGNKSTSLQLGTIQSYALASKYVPQQARKDLDTYIKHAVEKDRTSRVHNQKASRGDIGERIKGLLSEKMTLEELYQSCELNVKETIMGIQKEVLLTEDEVLKHKLQLLIDMIRYKNREVQ